MICWFNPSSSFSRFPTSWWTFSEVIQFFIGYWSYLCYFQETYQVQLLKCTGTTSEDTMTWMTENLHRYHDWQLRLTCNWLSVCLSAAPRHCDHYCADWLQITSKAQYDSTRCQDILASFLSDRKKRTCRPCTFNQLDFVDRFLMTQNRWCYILPLSCRLWVKPHVAPSFDCKNVSILSVHTNWFRFNSKHAMGIIGHMETHLQTSVVHTTR